MIENNQIGYHLYHERNRQNKGEAKILICKRLSYSKSKIRLVITKPSRKKTVEIIKMQKL